MSFYRRWWNSLVRSLFQMGRSRKWALRSVGQRRSLRLNLEMLEDRLTPSNYVVNITNDAGTTSAGTSSGTNSGDLRYCINQAEQSGVPATITFASSFAAQTIYLDNRKTTGPEAGSNLFADTSFIVGSGDSITIDGSNAPGLIMSGGFVGRPFLVTGSGTLNLDNLTLEGGYAAGAAGNAGSNGGGGGGGSAGLGGGVLVDGGTFTANVWTKRQRRRRRRGWHGRGHFQPRRQPDS